MGKIKNVEIKKITNFLGHEQEPLFQCDIYYKGHKVGFYSQDSWGGADNIDIIDNNIKAVLNNLAQQYIKEKIERGEEKDFYKEHPDYYDLGSLINDIYTMNNFHKTYKNNIKKGRTNMLVYGDKWYEDKILSFNSVVPLELVKEKYNIKDNEIKYYFTSEKDFEIV